MKLISAVLAPERLDAVAAALAEAEVYRMTVTECRGVARAGAKVSDLIAGLRPLHGFGGSYAAFQAYRRVSTEAKKQSIVVARVNGVYAGLALALNSLLAAAVTLWAGLLTFRGEITVGQLVMAVGLAQFLIEPLRMFSEMPKYVMIARASAARMALVLAAPPVMSPGTQRPSAGGGIEIAGGFIGKNDAGVIGGGAGDGDTLLFAAREFGGPMGGARRDAEEIKQFHGPRLGRSLVLAGNDLRHHDVF